MLDETIPLTTGEYDDGKPNVKRYYKYMKSYSPYDNASSLSQYVYFNRTCMTHKYSIGSLLNGLLSYEL
jgi:protease II